MTKPKPGAMRGGTRKGAGRPPKPGALTVTVTVAMTPETAAAIDADRARIQRDVPEATVDRASWVRSAVIEKLGRVEPADAAGPPRARKD